MISPSRNRDPFWEEWIRDFIAEWRTELTAPDEFWQLIARLSPLEMRIIREAISRAILESTSAV